MSELYLRSSPHVHTRHCDGRNTPEEMALAAISRGFVSLGFSGHAWQGFLDESNMTPQREALYLSEVRALKKKYAGSLRIWCGLERDACSAAAREPFDYVIGSVHFLPCPDGNILAVDAEPPIVQEGLKRCFGGDGVRLAMAYFRKAGQYIREYRPDIIGHFDLVSKNNRYGELYDPDHPAVLDAACEALEESILGCGLMEVNTGGMAYGRSSPIPAFGGNTGEAGGGDPSSDCHEADRSTLGIGPPRN